jgi:hypothetical protein
MIQELPDGKLILTFDDWSEEMIALSHRFFQLPLPRGASTVRTHEVGIDRLRRLKLGKMAIRVLYLDADMLTHCPDHKEVVKLGKAIIRATIDLDRLVARPKIEKIQTPR